MKNVVTRWTTGVLTAAAVVCLAFAAGCGSDVSGGGCEEGEPCEGGGVCTDGVCATPDTVGGDASDGISPPPVDTGGPMDVSQPEDVAVEPDVPAPIDIPTYDTQPPDLIPDRSGPVVIDFAPKDGEDDVPAEFVVRVVFDEPVRPTTIVQGNTFSVTNVVGDEVPGTLELLPDPEAPSVVIFRPTESTLRGSPYRVTVTPSIMDLVGNRMEEFVRFRFFTEPLDPPNEHRALAEQFAPHVRQAIEGPKPEYDYVTGFDFDDDWDLTNNVAAIKTADAVPGKVYYAVVETKTHWFITYLFYHPYHQDDDRSFGNDLAGAQIVVERATETPLLVQTYFKTQTQEDILAYVTTESGLSGTYVDGSWPAAELFPEGGYPAYLTPHSHQSCLWLDRDNTSFEPCYLPPADVDSLAIVEYVFTGAGPEALVEEEGVFPFETGDDPVDYALEDVLVELWPRRMDVADLGVVFADDKVFESNDDTRYGQRPGAGLRLGTPFVNPVDSEDVGLPPWRWRWKPQAGGFVDMAPGTFFLDPAYFVKKRFPSLPDWDAEAKTGFSLDYCYNPFLSLNLRPVDPDCAPAE